MIPVCSLVDPRPEVILDQGEIVLDPLRLRKAGLFDSLPDPYRPEPTDIWFEVTLDGELFRVDQFGEELSAPYPDVAVVVRGLSEAGYRAVRRAYPKHVRVFNCDC